VELRTANSKGTYGLFNYGLAPTGTYIYGSTLILMDIKFSMRNQNTKA
jgi:hypothetical protein